MTEIKLQTIPKLQVAGDSWEDGLLIKKCSENVSYRNHTVIESVRQGTIVITECYVDKAVRTSVGRTYEKVRECALSTTTFVKSQNGKIVKCTTEGLVDVDKPEKMCAGGKKNGEEWVSIFRLRECLEC